MSIGALDAARAYGRTLGGTAPAGKVDIGGSAEGADFGGMVENLVTETASTMRSAEAASAKQVAGKGDLIDVVTAIGAAEMALDTLVAVRDRVVGAYTDIMRMQI
ncbi:MAG: flagellar hook-basal body complex protein FliE [Pseudomonadota bacterium]|jgi:flagellar hook-basal body complex protein FliE|nr:flagellar hook-basal body complex protein FliE [Pseudomonadota bacterium]